MHLLIVIDFKIVFIVAVSKPQKEPMDPTLRKQRRRLMRSQVLRQMVVGGGRGIGRGIDWKWREMETGGQSVESALVAEHREGLYISK